MFVSEHGLNRELAIGSNEILRHAPNLRFREKPKVTASFRHARKFLLIPAANRPFHEAMASVARRALSDVAAVPAGLWVTFG